MSDVNVVPQTMSVADIAMRRLSQLADMCGTEAGGVFEEVKPFCTQWHSAIPDGISEVVLRMGAEAKYRRTQNLQRIEVEAGPKR